MVLEMIYFSDASSLPYWAQSSFPTTLKKKRKNDRGGGLQITWTSRNQKGFEHYGHSAEDIAKTALICTFF